jgi:peptide/nickel transport system permease protein
MAAPSIESTGAPSVAHRRRLPGAVILGGAILIVMILAALMANWLAPYPFDELHVRDRLTGPSFAYWAGTDEYGRDVLSRTLFGSRLSLFLGFAATSIALLLGVPIGLVAGYYRGLVDELLMRTLDVVMSFPSLLFVMLILSVMTPGPVKTAFIVGILFTPPVARVTRSVTLDLMTEEFIVAARAR